VPVLMTPVNGRQFTNDDLLDFFPNAER